VVSHMRELKAVIEGMDPSLSVQLLSLGRNTRQLRLLYETRKEDVIKFGPDAIVLQSGHNDVSAHSRYNRDPVGVRELYAALQDFEKLLRENHPSAIVFVSSLFPRVKGPSISTDQVGRYNELAKRFMEMIRSATNRGVFRGILNRELWSSVKQAKVTEKYFCWDGLHLSADGQRVVCACWIKQLHGIK
jgi:lysophospholipase L1-like esterase